jgi:hypothetical protein
MTYRLRRWRHCLGPVLGYLLLLVAGFVVYHRISLGVPRMAGEAHQHAGVLIDLERRLGILIEPRMQFFALHHADFPVLGSWLSGAAVRNDMKLIYSGGQIPWLGSLLLWLLLFRPGVFRRICLLAIVGSLIGLLIAAVYPVAPPRFAMAGPPYHMQDVSSLISSEKDLVRFGGFDPYASMPSLHVLWALITAAGLFQSTQRWGLRLLTFIFPAGIVGSVIITGNHYVLDCLGAAVLFGACLACHAGYRRFVHASGSTADSTPRPVHDRRTAPDLRALDFPILFCAVAGMLLLPTSDTLPRILGLLLLAVGALAPPFALRRISGGASLRASSPTAEWLAGYLIVLGATTLGASDPTWRIVGSMIWAVAGLLPLLSRYDPVSPWLLHMPDRMARPIFAMAPPLPSPEPAGNVMLGERQEGANHLEGNRTA